MTKEQKTYLAISVAVVAIILVVVSIFRSVGPAADAAYSEQLHHMEATPDPSATHPPSEHPAPEHGATRAGGKAKFNGM